MENSKAKYERLTEILDGFKFKSVHVWIIFLVACGALFDAVEQFNVAYAAPFLIQLWGITKAQVGLLTSFTFGGMAIGAILAGIIGDVFGRRITLIYNLGIFTFGALLAAFAPNFEMLLLARLIIGIGLGGEVNIGIAIISEIMPTKNRGSAAAIQNIAAGGLGTFCAALLGWIILGLLAPLLGGDSVAWRWFFGFMVIPALLIWPYRKYILESPRFLLSKGRISELNRVLTQLEKNTLSAKELKVTPYFEDNGAVKLEKDKVRFSEILSSKLAKRTIGIWIFRSMSLGAQITTLVFIPTILVSQGFDIVRSLFYTMLINAGGLVGGILASYLAGKVRRKILIGWGAILASGLAITFGYASSLPMILTVGFTLQIMFILLNTTVFIYIPELYPTRIRTFGMGTASGISVAFVTILPFIAGFVLDKGGTEALLSMIAIMYLIMALTIWRLGIETKDQSLERLELALESEYDSPSQKNLDIKL